MKKNSFIEGTIIASLAIIITKILGAIYVIPFYAIIGENGGVLYSYAYNIYNLFLNISTAGIPVAVSMVISEYAALEMFEAKERSYKISKKIITILSIGAFLILFLFAKQIGMFYIKDLDGGNNIKDVALVIRAISTCLLIIPFLSVLRGYLQGNKFIAPSSISQVVEQVIRVIVIIVGSYLAINVFKLSVPLGVSIALLGALFGGLVAYLYLRLKINKNKYNFKKSNEKDLVTNKEITKKIISYSIPLIIIAIIGNLYDLIDIKLILTGLNMLGFPGDKAELITSIIATWAPKICMIMAAISIGLTTGLIPHLIDSFTRKDYGEVNKKFNQALSYLAVLTLPMATGLFLLSKPIYTLFYGSSTYGPLILQALAILNIFTGVLTIVNTTLQGMKKFKMIYLNSVIGLLVNVALNIPMILLLNKIGFEPFYGSIIATIIGTSISMIIIFIYFKKEYNFTYKSSVKNFSKTLIPTFIMGLIVFLLSKVLPLTSGLSLLINLMIIIIIAASCYLFILYKNNTLYEVFGEEYIKSIINKIPFVKVK